MTSANAITTLLPPLARCKRLHLRRDAVLIHAPGFEDRTLASPERIDADAGAAAILFRYEPHVATNRIAEVRSVLTARGVAVPEASILTYDRFEPGDFEDRLRKRLTEMGSVEVTVDISTMSKLAILLVLKICLGLRLHTKIFYAEAESYSPTKDEFELAKAQSAIHRPSLQVFTGVHGVVRVSSLASVAMQGQPTAALVFMSFNDALTQVLLNTVYPGRLLLINGRPPKHSWREEATAWIHDQVRREWEEDNPLIRDEGSGLLLPARVVSTLDYRETVALLLELYWQLSAEHRILLAPAGSKMQAVGSLVVKALHPDIHIEYPSPEGFVPTYSVGLAECWLLDLGDFAERLKEISDCERREYLEIHRPS